jgi:uracil phosphoribosyltransferase
MGSDVRVLGEKPSLLGQFLAEVRDVEVQRDPMRFRRNIERIGEVMAYEISQVMSYGEREVSTPLGVARCRSLSAQPVLATILRAGLPLHQGLLNYFDRAENAFISAFRKHEGDEDRFEVEVEYLSSPSLDGKTVILCDPMLASGSSMVLAYKALLEHGTPAELHVAVVIASEEGVDFARSHLPSGTSYWIGAVDPTMTPRKYIVPGLGDAGDLAYGAKE